MAETALLLNEKLRLLGEFALEVRHDLGEHAAHRAFGIGQRLVTFHHVLGQLAR